jgi:hypothetical protein
LIPGPETRRLSHFTEVNETTTVSQIETRITELEARRAELRGVIAAAAMRGSRDNVRQAAADVAIVDTWLSQLRPRLERMKRQESDLEMVRSKAASKKASAAAAEERRQRAEARI